MHKIEIKLKDYCLTCEHFCLETSSIGYYGVCGSDERKIACVHMLVCQTYNGNKPIEVVSCGQYKRWCPDGTYGTGANVEKEQYGTCDITKTASRKTIFAGMGGGTVRRRNRDRHRKAPRRDSERL